MLRFEKSAISYSEFIKLMESEYSIDLSDPQKHEDILYSFCSERLVAVSGSYPNIYTFLGTLKRHYVLMFDKAERDHKLYEILYSKKRKYRITHTPAEVFVINEGSKWSKESRLAVYDSYRIKDCIYEPLEGQEIRIWCQRNWHEGHRGMPENKYLEIDGEDLTSIDQANEYINRLIEKDYKLAPYELARPNYIITY